jgi:hypothetical protein
MQTNTSIILVFALAQKRISKYGIRPCLPVVPARRRPVVPARRGGGGKKSARLGWSVIPARRCPVVLARQCPVVLARRRPVVPARRGGGGEDVESKCTGHFGLFL